MTRLLLAVAGLALSVCAFAEELYLPANGNTRVRIANTSPAPTTVSIELLGDKPTTTTLPVAAGETAHWQHVGSAAVRITSNDKIAVTAHSTCVSCGTSAKLPVLDAQHLLDEGTLDTGVVTSDRSWSSGLAMINPETVPARVTLSLYRGEALLEQMTLRVGARGSRFVPIAKVFRTTPAGNERITFIAPHDVLLFAYDANARSGTRFFRPAKPVVNAGKPRRRAVRKTPSIPFSVPQTIDIAPSKDNMLVEDGEGGWANGQGRLFAGPTRRAGLRRALLAFNVAAQIPPGSRITRASLTITVTRALTQSQVTALHRVTTDWGEGTSNTEGGTGAQATANDATWIHTFYPNHRWTREGGDFESAADATANIGSNGPQRFESSAALVARVQTWLDQPATNFGWMLLGNETGFSSARGFESRESEPDSRPKLTVEFTR